MPRVKFDYIVSFSSEDPEHPASNLLSPEVSKKKWLCAEGETSASVVIQLEKAVQIRTVAVGAHHAALVEVLVGRSETPADPYQVLVASCVFLSPSESRAAEGAGVERVRSFSRPDGSGAGGGVWAQRWDRLRLLVSQPYNKHCKFGVSFVHVFSPDPEPSGAVSPHETRGPRSSLVSALDALTTTSDDDEFKPGELFAQHMIQTDTSTDTGSQIRRASSQLLRTDSTTPTPLLVKAPARAPAPRNKHTHTTADNARNETHKTTRNDRNMETATPHHRSDTKRKRDVSAEQDSEHKKRKDSSNKRDMSDTSQDTDTTREGGAPPKGSKQKRGAGEGVLAGVVCVLSGYENPRRAAVRNTALALGARVHRDWGPDCTHLICAFPKTPKLAAVRRGAGGARVPAVLAEWVEQCARRRRRLPEEWYSTEPERRVSPPPSPPPPSPPADSDDTDDEIQRVLRVQPSHRARTPTGQMSTSDDEGGTTDVEGGSDDCAADVDVAAVGAHALPPLLRDMAFVSAGPLVDRYVRAYGGTLLEPEEVEDGVAVYALREADGGAGGAGRGLRLRWLWRAHADRKLPPIERYLLD